MQQSFQHSERCSSYQTPTVEAVVCDVDLDCTAAHCKMLLSLCAHPVPLRCGDGDVFLSGSFKAVAA